MSSNTIPAAPTKHIVIIGGGIIGSCSAYYLASHPSFDPSTTTITLLEASSIGAGASGKAGGLLALWAYPRCIVPLSYRLHEELAQQYQGEKKWGYRRVHVGEIDCVGRDWSEEDKAKGDYPALRSLRHDNPKDVATTGDIDGNGDAVPADLLRETPSNGNGDGQASVSLQKRTTEAIASLRGKGVPDDLDWIDPDCLRGYEEMGTPMTTAQVHPYLFTTSIARIAEEKGVKIIMGQVTSINLDKSEPEETTIGGGGGGRRSDKVTSVTYNPQGGDSSSSDFQTIPATHIVLSAGPWTQSLWPAAPITALRAHSICIRPSKPVSAYALFTSIALPASISSHKTSTKGRRKPTVVSPEIYARPNNEVYACGEGDTLIPLPSLAANVHVDESRCEEILHHVAAISPHLRNGTVTARQACYLPNVDRNQVEGREAGGGGPIVGLSTKVAGLVFAAGHTCWGIQNGPGTGKLVSEFVFGGRAASAQVGELDPRRFGL